VLLSVTNTREGFGFALPNETNTTDFVRQMFPYFYREADQAANYYTALDATIPQASDQAVAIMGECSHVLLVPCNEGRYQAVDSSNLYLPNVLLTQGIQR
jgi:hypothetical protein